VTGRRRLPVPAGGPRQNGRVAAPGEPASPSDPRRLVVLRHAKSDWPVGVADPDRPLGRRGRRDASVAGRWIADEVGTPDVVWCSPARRTRETWQLAAEEVGGAPAPRYDERIYEATVADLLAVLRDTPKDARLVVLVGHNPGVQDLVLDLASGGDRDARVLAETKYPTSGLAVLEVSGPWSKVAEGSGALASFVVPRG